MGVLGKCPVLMPSHFLTTKRIELLHTEKCRTGFYSSQKCLPASWLLTWSGFCLVSVSRVVLYPPLFYFMEGCCLTKTHLSITSSVSKLSTSKFFWRSQGIILLSQDKIVLINTSNHCNICTSESVPLPWAVLFQPCHDFSQCLTWACLCKTHCNHQTNETQKGRKKKHGAKIPCQKPKTKMRKNELLVSQEERQVRGDSLWKCTSLWDREECWETGWIS